MATCKRLRTNFIKGTIDTALSDTDTTISGDEVANLPAVAADDIAVLVLDADETDGDPEVVYVTDHTAAATTATIVRGREGTTARAHSSGTDFLNAPTEFDFGTSLRDTGGNQYRGSLVIGSGAYVDGSAGGGNGEAATVVGSNAHSTAWAVAVGTGASADQWSTAVGPWSQAFGEDAVAVGENTVTAAFAAVALGYQATANNAQSVALGYNSLAQHDGEVALGRNQGFVTIPGGLRFFSQVGVSSGATTMDASKKDTFIRADASAGNVTINLITADAAAVGRILTVKKIDSSANTVTLDGSGAETIDGAATYVLTAQWESVTVMASQETGKWYVINKVG